MKKINEIQIPTLEFKSDYFQCPSCKWQYPDPLLVKDDKVYKTCAVCHHPYLVRIK